MDQRSVRVVVGQGDPARGALRDVLTDDGFDVVGMAGDAVGLAHALQAEQPDVVVLDDAIGIAAAQLVAELAPRAKLVVIWPAGVMPIGGAARVEPGEVTMALSATVGLVAGVELSGLSTIERPDWIEKVRKDPATLREKLASGGAAPARPSVTELQRRGQRLHPSTGMGRRRTARSTGDGRVAAAAILPLVAGAELAGAGPAGVTPADRSEATNRRIGMIALGGATVAGALMIALSFGAHRQPSVIASAPFLPPPAATSANQPAAPTPNTPSGPEGARPTTIEPSTTGGTPTPGPTASSEGTGGVSDPVAPGGGGTGGGSTSGTDGPLAAAPGASAAHNPHGAPPGLLRAVGSDVGPTPANGHTAHGAHPAHPTHPAHVHTHKR